MTMTAAEFEEAFAERSSATVVEIRKLGRIVVPCEEDDCVGVHGVCEGWVSVYKDAKDAWAQLMSRRHQNLVSDHPLAELRFQPGRPCEVCGFVQLENLGAKYFNISDNPRVPEGDLDELYVAYRYILEQESRVRTLRRELGNYDPDFL